MDSQTLVDFLQQGKVAAVGGAGAAVGRALKRHAGKGLLVGGGAIAGGMGHSKLVQRGKQHRKDTAEAEELSQLLQAYPELMYEVPGGYSSPYEQQYSPYHMPDFPF